MRPARFAYADRRRSLPYGCREGPPAISFQRSLARPPRPLAVGLLAVVLGWAAPPPAAAESPKNADELLVVDCLLPGQVRKLGTFTTFLTARRPIKTTARDCAIRGGEYTAYDRASYATALAVWLPRAKGGDPEAQLNVGEIYEKGLGLAPDYQAAALWYRKAAAAGNTQAQINLGHLYERGLGVERDPQQALAWYRKASGLPEAMVIDPGTLNDQHQAMSALRSELARSKQQIEQLRGDLAQSRRELRRARSELERRSKRVEQERDSLARARKDLERKRAAAQDKDSEELQRAAAQLAQRESELARQRREIARLRTRVEQSQRTSARYQDQLADLESVRAQAREQKQAAESLRAELTDTHAALEDAKAELARRTRAADAARKQLDEERAKLERERKTLAATNADKLARTEAALHQREAELTARERQIAALQKRIERAQARARTEASVRAEQPDAGAATQSAVLAGPDIEIIDPPLPTTRGPAVIKLRSGVMRRAIIGRVTAPAGLLTVLVNDRPAEPNSLGVFRAEVPVQATRTPVTIAAVDRQGKRTSVDFVLSAETATASRAEKSAPSQTRASSGPAVPLPAVDFGSYHALVIGNDDYRHLPHLDTAVRDAKAVARILRTKYGFETELLLNATRYDILEALNKLRQRLNKNDNLLIYYAGHGTLDRVNMRGQWLPVDAEPDSTANWISNISITDILNVMAAKQILVVADSCYSGALTRSALAHLQTGMTTQEHLNWLRTMAHKRARTALTSGGLKPVLDAGGGGHSVFAEALLEALKSNEGILGGQQLYQEVAARVAYAASSVRFEQVPEYAPIQYAGHEGGDFFLVARK